ncbi:MAG: sensor domain-containing diguanylate cyclase [Candidatus Omnitrophica bacterium]|nr:sensor domain-containing diguanylate cyclase [Candidatus Omnitrophota bacterium]
MEQVRLQEELRKTRQELLLLYEIGNLIRTTLLLDEVIYLILSAVTSHEGLAYNRAILFMVDESGTQLEGKMGIGPTHPEASPLVWKMIEQNKITLEGLLDVYHKSGKQIDIELNKIARQIRMPIEKSYGILAKTVIQSEPALVTGRDVNHELCDIRLQGLGITEFAVVPLHGKNHVVGVLMIDNVTTKKPITQEDVRRIMMLANHAGLALENAKTYNEVVVNSQQDSLTKLWNHGHFQKLLIESVNHAKALDKPLSLLVFDVDDFKTYNDTYGHQAGDKALEEISSIAKTVMRRMDDVARYGGEEFAAVLPGTTKQEAIKLAERLRDIIRAQTATSHAMHRKVTVSVGVASYPEDAEDKDKLIYCADGALYEAKRSGKDQVRAYKKPAARFP